jgi:spore germination cell wall hydrolase CwlJ-like protein
MAVSRKRRRSKPLRLCIGALFFGLIPTAIGFQDLGALLVRQPAVAARARAFVIASPFRTIQTATFSMTRPIGTAIPHPPLYALANFDPDDITGSIGAEPLGDAAELRFPSVNRKTKGDSAISRARAPMPPLPPLPAQAAIEPAAGAPGGEPRIDPYVKYRFGAVADESAEKSDAKAVSKTEPVKDADRIFFGADPLAGQRRTIAPWAPGETPLVLASRESGDADIKQSALAPAQPGDLKSGESVADKGVVTGPNQRPRSPAERLSLAGASRVKAEKCLANAVYFEARDEPVRAQIAVAQVVLNRVFSPFYPNDVCGVVYQNSQRHLACQFTFACDGKLNLVTEPDAWARAQHIARDILDGKLWMPDVAKSTHYHDDWAHPNWVGEMRRMDKLGGLIFYRPRAWGDGAAEPRWGDAKTTAEIANKL